MKGMILFIIGLTLFLGVTLFFLYNPNSSLSQTLNPFSQEYQKPTLFPDQLQKPNQGSASIISSPAKWQVTHSTDTDWEVKIDDPYSKTPEICLVNPKAKSLNDIPNTKELYNDKGTKITDLSKQAKLSAKTEYGYCYQINKEEYVKFGLASTIVEYQNQSRIEYDLDWATANITLYKNISGEYQLSVDDIFISVNEDTYKFGANDTVNEGVESYKYRLETTQEILGGGNKYYLQDDELTNHGSYLMYDRHVFDFTDICSRGFECTDIYSEELNDTITQCNISASCEFNKIDSNTLEITFNSDKDIDPQIYIGGIKIPIIDAQHLDSSRSFIENVFNETRYQDDYWTDYIPEDDYVRVTYVQNLTSTNDIVVIAESLGTSSIEIYEEGGNELIASIDNIQGVDAYKTYLTGLGGTQDTFDLKIIGDDVKFDYITDPVDIPYGYNLLNDSINFGTMDSISATSENSASYVAEKLSDNALDSSWLSANGASSNQNITINFTDSFYFDNIIIFDYSPLALTYTPNNTRVWVSDDGVTYTNITDYKSLFSGKSGGGEQYDLISFSLQNKKYLKIEFKDNWGGSVIGSDKIRVFRNTTNLANLTTTSVSATHVSGGSVDYLSDKLYTNYWYSSNDYNTNLTWDFGSEKLFDSMFVNAYTITHPYLFGNYSILVSDDGSSWTEVLSDSLPDAGYLGGEYYINFTQQNKRYLRLWMKDNYDSNFILTEINIFEQELAGDTTPPEVNLQSPANNTNTSSATHYFAGNFTDNVNLYNSTLYIWNSTEQINITTINLNGTVNQTNISVTLPFEDTFYWNYLVCDNSSNCAFNNTNWTINYEVPTINLTIITPEIDFNEINVTQNEFFNVTVNVTCISGECGTVNISLDPERIEHSATTDTICRNGECNLVIYGGIKNTYEDGRWKKVEDARSLKGSGIDCFVESDGEHLVECLDWNYTTKTLKLEVKDNSKVGIDIPLKNYVLSYDDEDKEIKTKNKENKYNFNSLEDKKEIVISSNLDDEVHFGEESTTITLQGNTSDVLGDNSLWQDFPDNNYGALASLSIHAPKEELVTSIIKFNISAVPEGATITYANLSLWIIYNGLNTGESFNATVHYVDNLTWDQMKITWNNQPSYDINATDWVIMNATLTPDESRVYWNVLDALVGETSDNFSIYFNGTDQVGVDNGQTDWINFASSDYITVSKQPYLNITYDDLGATPKSGLISTTIGDTPFYTNVSNPNTTTSLSAGESYTYTWWVNATGGVGTTHVFYAYANLTSNASIQSTSDDWNVTIRSGLDTIPPYFIGLENQSIFSNESLRYDIEADDDIAFGNFSINWTSVFEINESTGIIVNTTGLNNTLYWINVTINDTSNNQNSSTFFVNVTASDLIPPYFTDLENQSILSNQSLYYDINATDDYAGYANFTINWTNVFEINGSTGIIVNTTGLNNSLYWINVTINDSANNQNSSIFYVNVTSATPPADDLYPTFTNLVNDTANNSQYDPDFLWGFNATIINTNGTVGLDFNGTNYTASNVSEVFNVTIQDLGAGDYSYYWWAYGNGTSGYYNTSEVQYYTIAVNNTYALNLTEAPATDWSETYGTETTVTGVGCPPQLECKLIRNDTSGNITNPDVSTLGAGSYNYTFNSTANANYSGYEFSNVLVIAQNTSVVFTWINNSQSNLTIINNTEIELNATLGTGDSTGVVRLYNNGTIINTGVAPLYNLTGYNVTGVYNITAIYNGTQNFTFSSETWYLNVTAEPDTDFPYFTDLENQSIFSNQSLRYDINATDPTSTINFTINWTTVFEINSSTGIIVNTTGLNNSLYWINVTINDTSGNQNSSVFFVNVTEADAIDLVPPYFIDLENQSLFSNQSLRYDINATDDYAFANFTINWTTVFEINESTGLIVNKSAMDSRLYWINVTINDTSNNQNSSIFFVNISDADVIDITPPYFDNPRNFTHTVNKTAFSESFTASDDIGIEIYILNDTDVFNITQAGLITNVSALTNISFHNFNLTVRDTSNNENSVIFWINVTQSFTKCNGNYTTIQIPISANRAYVKLNGTSVSNDRVYIKLCNLLEFK